MATASEKSDLIVYKGPEKWASKTLSAAIELANDIFWTSRSKIIMLNYNVETCTIDSMYSKFSGPPKKSKSRNDLTPAPKDLNIPEVYLKVVDIPPTKEGNIVISKLSASSPEDISLNSFVAQECKNVSENTKDYNRLILFIAIVSLNLQ